MALISPGVEVQVIDESFYTPAEPGTVPLIVVATAENKINGAGTGTASGTPQLMQVRYLKLQVNENLLKHLVHRSLKRQCRQVLYTVAKETNMVY